MIFNPSFLKELTNNHASAIVGRILKNIEVVEKQNISEKTKFNLLKSLLRELLYEEMRDFSVSLNAYNEGRKIENYKIYKPKTE